MYTIIVNTPGPQGPTGPQGPAGTGSIDTSSLATTGSNTFIGNQIITGSVDITGSLTVNTVNVGANTINFVDENQNILTSLSYSGSNLILSSGSIALSTGSLVGTASYANEALTASYALNTSITIDTSSLATTGSNTFDGNQIINGSISASNVTSSLYGTSSWAEKAITASYVNTLNQDVLITGSLTVLQGATIYGSSSFLYVTASQLALSASYISVNVFEPIQRFGGLYVYDSGSSTATSSLTWDSLNNHWIYSNASGAAYTGGGLISGPRNTGSLGDETFPTLNKIVRGQGGDHIYDSNITDNDTKVSIGISTDITGSLNVTGGVTGSFIGDGSQLTGIFLEKRHDFTGSYSYCGTAPSGSSESANVWDINRITIYPAGNTLIQSASLVSWTNRYNNIYN